MSKRPTKTIFFLLLPLIPFLIGCYTSIIKRGIKEIKGADAYITEIKIPSRTKLTQYKYIFIENYKNIMGNTIPPSLPARLHKYTYQELLKEAPRYVVVDSKTIKNIDEQKLLIIRPTIIHYVSSGGISKILGKSHHIICRIELIDRTTKTIIGTANISVIIEAITRSKEWKENKLTHAVAENIKKWIDKHSYY